MVAGCGRKGKAEAGRQTGRQHEAGANRDYCRQKHDLTSRSR